MKQETEGLIIEPGKEEAIEANRYAQVWVAEKLAAEIAQRVALRVTTPNHLLDQVHRAAATVLFDWFTGKWKPGGPTDPPDGAPPQT